MKLVLIFSVIASLGVCFGGSELNAMMMKEKKMKMGKMMGVKAPFFDCNADGLYQAETDVVLPRKGYKSSPSVILDGRGVCSNGEPSDFILPRGVTIKAYQVEIIAENNVILYGKLYSRFRNGNRPRPEGNAMGTMIIRALAGSLYFGPELRVKPDLINFEAGGDIVIAEGVRIFQFQNAFAAPIIRNPDDYNIPGQISKSLELGEHLLTSHNGNIILERGAKVFFNDRARVSANNIIMDQSSLIFSRNELHIEAKESIVGEAGEKKKRSATLRSGYITIQSPLVEVPRILGFKKGQQCKLGGGGTPGCIQRDPVLEIKGEVIPLLLK